MPIDPERLVGTRRRSRENGQVYEVTAQLPGLPKRMSVRYVETGEEVNYPWQQISDDPPVRGA
jgi:hypothetical protein